MQKISIFWTSATLAALLMLYWLFPGSSVTNFSDSALGQETQTVIGTYDGDRVHCFKMAHADECLKPARNRNLEINILWLGNSQLHAINQRKLEDLPASSIAAAALRAHDTDLLTFSQPNANLAEHWILYEALAAINKFDVLVLPVVFDDMREQRIRREISAVLTDSIVANRMQEYDIGREMLQISVPVEKDGRPLSLQQRSERWITAVLDECCGWEMLRSQARGATSIFIYNLRNYVFGINASSIRRIIPAAYNRNIAALDVIFEAAKHHGTKMIIYIPPLRPDAPAPYDPREYASFLVDVAALAERHGVQLHDFENLVPGPLWGLKDSTIIGGGAELDFMHFQGGGHALLADRVYDVILETINDI